MTFGQRIGWWWHFEGGKALVGYAALIVVLGGLPIAIVLAKHDGAEWASWAMVAIAVAGFVSRLLLPFVKLWHMRGPHGRH